jgi:hypothetical protein
MNDINKLTLLISTSDHKDRIIDTHNLVADPSSQTTWVALASLLLR